MQAYQKGRAMRLAAPIHPIALLLAALLAILLALPGSAIAENIVATVKGEPITGDDVAQRMLWQARTVNFGERMKAALASDACRKHFLPEKAPHPHSQEEAQQIAARIKKEMIGCAKRLFSEESGDAARKDAIEALIDDKLKLQAAKKLRIGIRYNEVEEALAARAGRGPDRDKPDMNAFYAQFEKDGIRRETIREIIRVELAWRAVIRHISGAGNGSGADPPQDAYENLSRSSLQ